MASSTTIPTSSKEMGSSIYETYPIQPKRSFFLAQFTFRSLAISLLICAISIMVTNEQTVIVFGVSTEARYNYSSAFKFLVGAEAVVTGFTLVSMVIISFVRRSEAHHIINYFYLFLHDLVMMILLTSGCGAATAIGYVGRYGEKQEAWSAICDYVPKFCNKVVVSLVFSYLGFFSYLVLTIVSAHNLMSPFQK